MVGASRERVNRELGHWRERGLIAVEDGVIVIHRPENLRALVAEEFG
jgi:CRP-like cAMP-binding protein